VKQIPPPKSSDQYRSDQSCKNPKGRRRPTGLSLLSGQKISTQDININGIWVCHCSTALLTLNIIKETVYKMNGILEPAGANTDRQTSMDRQGLFMRKQATKSNCKLKNRQLNQITKKRQAIKPNCKLKAR